MKRHGVLILLLGLWANLYAQKLEVYGYFEPQLMGIAIKGNFYQLHSNKLRVDLKAKVGDNVTFGANFDYITYHGKTKWNILDYLPESVTAVVPPTTVPAYNFVYDNRNFLDNAYLKLSFKFADLTLGKQQISLGTGYAWNPTDVFNIKDLLDPTYEQPGHNAIRFDIPLGHRYNLVVLYTPEDEWENCTKLLRLKGGILHFDYSFIVIERPWTFTDYLTFIPLVQKRQLFGADMAGQVLGLGVWGEVAYNRMEVTEDFWEAVVGLDYTFDPGTYVLCEYYRNTLGKADYRQYDLNDWMRLIMAETKALSRDQLYAFVNHPATDLLNIGCSFIASLSDGSVAIVPTVMYNIYENVELTFFGTFYTGREGTAYASNLGNGGIIRARVYF